MRAQSMFLPGWRRSWAPLLYGLLLVAAFAPTMAELFREWIERPEYGHGLLMPPVAAWVIWDRRHKLAALKRRDTSGWFSLLAGLGLLPVIGFLMLGEMKLAWALKPYAMVGALAAGIAVFYGWRGLRALAVPLVVLLLMCPLPYRVHTMITLPLKRHAAVLATGLLDLSGLRIGLDGNLIHVPGIDSLWVADACSGVRSLISLVSVAILGCLFWRRHSTLKVLLVASCVPLSIVVNGLRIWLTATLSVHVSPAVAQGFFHLFEGFLLFGVAAILLGGWGLLLDRLLPKRALEQAAPLEESETAPPGGRRASLRRVAGALALVTMALAIGGVYHVRAKLGAAGFDAAAARRMQASLSSLPMVAGGGDYRGDPIIWDKQVIENSGADVYHAARFTGPEGRIFQVFVGGAIRNAENFHTPSVCLPAGGWEALQSGAATLVESGPEVQRLLLQRGSQRMLVYFWFQAGQRRAPDEWTVRYYRLLDLLSSAPLSPTLICSIYVPIVGGVEASEAAAVRFIDTMAPYLREATASGAFHG